MSGDRAGGDRAASGRAASLTFAGLIGVIAGGLLVWMAHRMPLTTANGSQMFAWPARYVPVAAMALIAGCLMPRRWIASTSVAIAAALLMAVPVWLAQLASVNPSDAGHGWFEPSSMFSGGELVADGFVVIMAVAIPFLIGASIRWLWIEFARGRDKALPNPPAPTPAG